MHQPRGSSWRGEAPAILPTCRGEASVSRSGSDPDRAGRRGRGSSPPLSAGRRPGCSLCGALPANCCRTMYGNSCCVAPRPTPSLSGPALQEDSPPHLVKPAGCKHGVQEGWTPPCREVQPRGSQRIWRKTTAAVEPTRTKDIARVGGRRPPRLSEEAAAAANRLPIWSATNAQARQKKRELHDSPGRSWDLATDERRRNDRRGRGWQKAGGLRLGREALGERGEGRRPTASSGRRPPG